MYIATRLRSKSIGRSSLALKAIVLQNMSGDHLGLILCAIPEGQLRGDCVFSIIPKKPELFDNPEVQELFARRDLGESQIQLAADFLSITIQSPNMDDMFIEVDESGAGYWRYVHADGSVQVGRALIPKK